jgi:hypothetical protein
VIAWVAVGGNEGGSEMNDADLKSTSYLRTLWMMGKENLPSVMSSQKLLLAVYCGEGVVLRVAR